MTENLELLAISPERQARLLDLLQEEGAESLFLRETLQLSREAVGAESVAAYLVEDGSYACAATLGGGDFPPLLDHEEALAWPSRRIGGGMLVGMPALSGKLPEPLALLLAVGLRLCRLRQRLEQQDFVAKYRGVEREALYDVGLAIASTLDLGQVSEEILLHAVSLLDARRGALYLIDRGISGEESRGPAGEEREHHYRLQSPIGGTARELLEVGQEPESADLLPGAKFLLAVPIEVEGERRGLLVVGDKESRSGVGPFPDEDRRALALFANQAALALEQARLHQEALEKERLEREMELAAQIQRGILPRRLPPIPGYELLGWTQPAREVGGDYWDIVPLDGSRFALLVADVSGKGVSAALLVSTLHSAVRLLLGRGEGQESLLSAVNSHLLEFSASNRFVTLLLGDLEPASGRLAYANAGHNPGLLLRHDGTIELLPASAVPLGLLPAAPLGATATELRPGDLLCLYSDGVTEATTPSGEELGMDGLESLLLRHQHASLPTLRSAIEAALREHTRGLPQGDDQTVVLLRRSAVPT